MPLRHSILGSENPTRTPFRLTKILTYLLVSVALVATSCSSGSNSPTNSGQKPVLTFGILGAPTSLDPAKGAGGGLGAIAMFPFVAEPLLTLNSDGSYGPGLAASFGYVSSGNRTFELTLRQDARFSDGQPVTAQAVKTWLEYVSATIGSSSYLALQSVEARDQWTVRLQLSEPNPLVPYYLATVANAYGAISSPQAVNNPQDLATTTAGAGQYMLDGSASVPGDHYTLVPNNYYYDQSKIRFSKVVVKVISNPSSMLQAIKAGQLDIAQGDQSTADAAATAGLTVASASALYVGLFFLDRSGSTTKPLADVRVRQALNYAVNRDAINTAINGKYGTPTVQISTLDGHEPSVENYYTYDPGKAKSLLAEAGYPNGFQMPLLCFSVEASIGKVCQAIAQDLLGVGVTPQIKSPSTVTEFQQDFGSGKFPTVVSSWSIDPTWKVYKQFLAPHAALNQHDWSDPVLDQLWQKGTSNSSGEGKDAWAAIVRRTVEQADFVPLYDTSVFYYFRADVVGGVAMTSPIDLLRPISTEWFKK